jgi:hypothetical protein
LHLTSRKRASFAASLLVVTLCLFFCTCVFAQVPQKSIRTLTGLVTDSGHEPIRNAVVQLRNTENNEILTYITDNTGHYNFKRLNGSADYEVWVEFRGHRSETRSISKFDSHMAKVLNFTVRTF